MKKRKRRSRKHPRLRALAQRAECGLVRAALAVGARVPLPWAGRLASVGAFLFDRLLPVRRGTVEANLEIAFGGQQPAARRTLIRGAYRSALMLFFEVAHLSRINLDRLAASIEPSPVLGETLRQIQAGQRVLLATAHIGNWEWGGAWFGLRAGESFAVIYKPLHNARLDGLLRRQRERLGLALISTRDKRQRELFARMRKGELVGILSDQDAGRDGAFIPFFGRPASTATGMARLALRFDLPILFTAAIRTAPGRFYFHSEMLPRPPEAMPREEATLFLMEAYHAALERLICRHPEQYFWWHRRWKTRPRPTAAAPAAAIESAAANR